MIQEGITKEILIPILLLIIIPLVLLIIGRIKERRNQNTTIYDKELEKQVIDNYNKSFTQPDYTEEDELVFF